jgi:competence protein ComEA
MDTFDDRSLTGRLDAWLLKLDAWRDRPSVAASALLIVGMLVAGGWWLGRPDSAPVVDDRIPVVALETPPTAAAEPTVVLVHVAGAVLRPGVYQVTDGSRVLDAIEAAGGPTPEADIDQLNLAAEVPDGVQIRVPVIGETVVAAPGLLGGPVDINRADSVGLERLPGVGPATAAAIVAHRDEFGPFASVDDLLLVPGIGPAKLETLRAMAVAR